MDSEYSKWMGFCKKSIGFLMSDRLMNMPPQIMPPMYKMLIEEIQDLRSQNTCFDYYVIWSKVYREVDSVLDQTESMDSAPKKKRKMSKDVIYYFQPEDELIEKVFPIEQFKSQHL